jgi:lipopolysaccharide transport system ATP-binding protein
MSNVRLMVKDVSLRFRVYGVGSQSLKKNLISIGTGGRLGRDPNNNIVIRAISNLSLELKEGDRLGVIGANGAGKSTLLRIIAGIYQPQEGLISATGRIAAIIDPSVAIDLFATGYENIRTRAVLLGIARGNLQNFVDRVGAVSELGNYLAMPVHTYSSGMIMRLNFALSISVDPDILILDEWLSLADRYFSYKAERHMRDLVEKSRILVMASHNLELLERVCNIGLFLEDGGVRFIGPIGDAIATYRNCIAGIDSGG